uniref:alpha-L-fucosidase n=2 Tax=Photinus pyralis TaxID=7054 RepID=A0A1Y1N5G3_PHOPY
MEDKFKATWESLDKRPIPQWYDDAKFGILLHWGVYSVPGIGSEWFWKNWSDGDQDAVSYMTRNYPPNFTYQDLARDFTANLYEPESWATLFEKSGAKYVILTGKHHDGYALWPSQSAFCWNAKEVGPHRDALGELCMAVRRKTALKFGIYYSQYEWFHPQYQSDKLQNYTEDKFVSQKTLPEMTELVLKYRPDIFWSDGDGEAEDAYWKSTKFLAWLYNDSPVKDTVVVNDKWGKGTAGRHGGYHNCGNNYNPPQVGECDVN